MTTKKPVIALLSPNVNAYSETFIQAHKENLKGNVKFFYGGLTPEYLEGAGSLYKLYHKRVFFLRIINKIKSRFYDLDNPHAEDWKEKILTLSLRKYRVTIAFAEYGPTAVHCIKACRSLKIPLIVHFHGYDASNKEIVKQYEERYRDVFTYASYIIVVSKQMKTVLLNLGAPAEKLIYNPCGPANAFFQIKPVMTQKKFFSVGRFVEKKAPYLTILAFKELLKEHPDATLHLGGDGPLLNVCMDMVKALGLQKSIYFTGVLNSSGVQKNMSDSLAYVQHSITAMHGDSEGAPVAIMEAGASGLPVVSTRHAGIPDIVIDGITGFLVEERDIKGMASQMSKLAGDFNLARTMGCAAKNRIKEYFSLDHHIDILNELIAQTLK